jgi:hypothetical protein
MTAVYKANYLETSWEAAAIREEEFTPGRKA